LSFLDLLDQQRFDSILSIYPSKPCLASLLSILSMNGNRKWSSLLQSFTFGYAHPQSVIRHSSFTCLTRVPTFFYLLSRIIPRLWMTSCWSLDIASILARGAFINMKIVSLMGILLGIHPFSKGKLCYAWSMLGCGYE